MNSRNLFLVIDLLAWESMYLILQTTAPIPENLIEKGTLDPRFSFLVVVVTDKACFPNLSMKKLILPLVLPAWFEVNASWVKAREF